MHLKSLDCVLKELEHWSFSLLFLQILHITETCRKPDNVTTLRPSPIPPPLPFAFHLHLPQLLTTFKLYSGKAWIGLLVNTKYICSQKSYAFLPATSVTGEKSHLRISRES